MDTKKCNRCGKTKPVGDFRKGHGKCKTCAYELYAIWAKTPSGKASIKKHQKSAKAKATAKRRQLSPKGQANIKKQNNSPVGRARKAKYNATDKAKASQARYVAKRRAARADCISEPYDRDELLWSTGGYCCYCSKEMEASGRGRDSATLDHVLCLDAGGDDAPQNIVPCCKACNSSKSGTELIEWLIKRNIEDGE